MDSKLYERFRDLFGAVGTITQNASTNYFVWNYRHNIHETAKKYRGWH